eukprot:gene9300-12530_t
MIALAFIVLCSVILSVVNAECANGCNGHGKCTSYDMCICCRNWQGSDCSERVCQFGLAHVDTPKGDLDASGALTGPNHLVVDNSFTYPYGTTEQFPQMEDSDLQELTDSAHYYMECSNKGTCDRSTGECKCYDGYDGVACQRASCPGYPNSCSGHGVCKSIKQLAESDNGNVYYLWDKDVTMGCECDKGYSGPDCSERSCKYGVDPLYLDDVSTVKYSTYDFAVLTTATSIDFTDGQSEAGTGYWAIRFFDNHGEDWVTAPIRSGALCERVVEALEALPNNVVPPGLTYCTYHEVHNIVQNKLDTSSNGSFYDAQHPASDDHPYKIAYKLALWETYTPTNQGELSPYTPTQLYYGSNDTNSKTVSGYFYRLKFYGNPGALAQPEIELYLDGKRPSLVSPGGKVITKVWTDGQQGEDKDYFADHCDGVTVTLSKISESRGPTSFLTGFTSAEKKLLKKCLGDSDFDTSNNEGVYDWDKGSKLYPHIVKLVRTVTSYTDGGYYAVLWYDSSVYLDNLASEQTGTFKLLNPFFPPDNFDTDNYDVYTTKGTLALTSNKSEATFGFASKYIYTVNATYDILRNTTTNNNYDGDISCENYANVAESVFHCLNRSDLFTLLNFEYPEFNPPHLNLYTAKRIINTPYQYSTESRFSSAPKLNLNNEMHYMTHMVTTDIATNWGATIGLSGVSGNVGLPQFHIYKFFPSTASVYEYVAPCSNRGVCDTSSGLCQCFSGYTSDSCHEQSSVNC